jgi:hypothetical protein
MATLIENSLAGSYPSNVLPKYDKTKLGWKCYNKDGFGIGETKAIAFTAWKQAIKKK